MQADPHILPVHIINTLSYRTQRPLISQREALKAGKPAHLIHDSSTRLSIPKNPNSVAYTVLDTPSLDAGPASTRTELGLVVNSALKFEFVGAPKDGASETVTPATAPAGPSEGEWVTEWMDKEDLQQDAEGMSSASKRQLTIGAQWSVPVGCSCNSTYILRRL